MNYRDWLQQLIYKIINPVVHGMIKVGITPNFITTTGLVMNIVAACVFVYAGMYKPGELVYVVGRRNCSLCRFVRHDGRTCGTRRQYVFYFWSIV
mgnify:CR=1 FL=1